MRLIEEAARLMRLPASVATGPAREALEEAVSLVAQIPFGSLVRPCTFSGEGPDFSIDGTVVPGTALARHLAGCREGVLIGGTLGVEGDRLLRRQSLLGLTEAAAMQAALSACLEEHLDALCASLERERPGFSLTSRFSPGYGDLPLAFQPYMMEALGMARLGVRLTASYMMAPVKSVTAIAGWREGRHPSPARCAACPDTSCPYRKTQEEK